MDTLREALEKINIDADLEENVPMRARTTFRIGGPADLIAKPRSREGLLALMAFCHARGLSPFILGGGSNLLVADAGIRGIVIDMSGFTRWELREGTDLEIKGQTLRDRPRGLQTLGTGTDLEGQTLGTDHLLLAEAGIAINALVEEAWRLGLSGFEWAAGLPGSLGGAVYMNARCYDHEIADCLKWVEVLEEGQTSWLPFHQDDWGYKKSPFQHGCGHARAVILSAAFRVRPGDRVQMKTTMDSHRADRSAKGHYNHPCAGSVFKNNRAFGAPSGVILDRLGFRGRRRGGAAVSDQHANIFINAGGAKAAEMVALIRDARTEAFARTGFVLEPEIVFAGDFPQEAL